MKEEQRITKVFTDFYQPIQQLSIFAITTKSSKSSNK